MRNLLENDCNQVSIWVGLMTIFIVPFDDGATEDVHFREKTALNDSIRIVCSRPHRKLIARINRSIKLLADNKWLYISSIAVLYYF